MNVYDENGQLVGSYDKSRLIEDELAEIAARVPEEAWDDLPDDLLDRLDYYLYDEQDDDGSKRNPGQVHDVRRIADLG